jgi:hypothetical protein
VSLSSAVTPAHTLESLMGLEWALEWAEECEAGDYLAEYESCGVAAEDDPGSRCGYSDPELSAVESTLRARGYSLVADDCGLCAALKEAP